MRRRSLTGGDWTECCRSQDRGGGSSLVRPKYSVTPLKGIQGPGGTGRAGEHVFGVAMEGEDPSKDTAEAREQLRNEAVNAAAKADAAVIVVGRSPAR